MTATRAATVMRIHAVLLLALGVLLVLDTWDGLYDRLDAPQAVPALIVQVGGAVLIAFAFVLWRAALLPHELRRLVAFGAAGASGASALIIAAWLIFRHRVDLHVRPGTHGGHLLHTQGIVELIVVAVVLGAFALAEAATAYQRPEQDSNLRPTP